MELPPLDIMYAGSELSVRVVNLSILHKSESSAQHVQSRDQAPPHRVTHVGNEPTRYNGIRELRDRAIDVRSLLPCLHKKRMSIRAQA